MADFVRNYICVYGTPERIAEAKGSLEERGTRNTEFSVMGLHIEINDEGNELEAQGIPGRWWTHYISSNPDMTAYAAERGVPAVAGGGTILQVSDGVLTATTKQDGTELIRGFYPFVASLADGWEVTSMEFLDPSHPIYALRPANPLEVM